ncbi:MAG: GTPase Era [Proteocatella sp.]
MINKQFKSGFVSIIGRPNVGKSTLINQLVGEKIAIMSDKPQTTRNQIKAIYNDDEAQIIFVDTPGMQDPRNKLGRYMLRSSEESMKGTDIILFVVDDSDYIGKADSKIIEKLQNRKEAKILIINKVDKMTNEKLIKIVQMYDKKNIFDEIIPTSALKGTNKNRVVEIIKKYLTYGPQFFPDDMVTDQPERVLVAEIIREKILHYTDEEIPHGSMVQIESMKKRPDKEIMDISAVIYCERENHKSIIIGKGGRKIKGIGSSARKELEERLGIKINLELWVKAKENWRDNENYIRNFGYNEKEI